VEYSNVKIPDRLEQIVRHQSRPPSAKQSRTWDPPYDLKETGDAYTLFIDLPGVEEDEIRISIRDRKVIVGGEREFDHDNEDAEEFIKIGRLFGPYAIEIPLPGDVCDELVRAKYRRGVLRLRLPKRNGRGV
jgi:HSP20 family protein